MMVTLFLVTVCWFGDVKGERYLINIVNALIMVQYALIALISRSAPWVSHLLPGEPVGRHQTFPLQHQHSQGQPTLTTSDTNLDVNLPTLFQLKTSKTLQSLRCFRADVNFLS